MKIMKRSIIALAIIAGSTQMAMASSQSESKGFVEDSSFNILSRAMYMNSDFRNGGENGSQITQQAGQRNGYAEESGVGIRSLYESGFTQGTIGFGVDAHSLSSIQLDSGRGRIGTGQFGNDSDGRAEDTQSAVGGAVKFRMSNTVLKYGSQMTDSPVFATNDEFLLPEVATGTLLTSNEIEGLVLTAGRFTALSSETNTGRDSANGGDLKSANIFGASYSFNKNFSGAIHASDVEDHFKKTYVNLNYNRSLSAEQSVNVDFNAYRTRGEGKEFSGKADNKIWSLAAAYKMGAHTFTLAHQRSSGDAGYVYGVDGNDTIFLANSVHYSDFNGEDENSWQARYDVDMASYGVPGLSFMTRYVTGTDITTRGANGLITDTNSQEHELNLEARYVIHEGAAKDLSFSMRNSIYRADSAYNGDVNEVRLTAEYPLSIL